ncbi:MAG TPA: hypothetical protein VF584_15595 [Longimicrobium sp.]
MALADWAVDMLVAGYDTPSLRVLAGLLPIEADTHAIVFLARRAARELGLLAPGGEALRRAYIYVVCRALLSGELDADTATEYIHSRVISPLDHPADLMPWCYLWEGNSAECDYVEGPNTAHVIAEAQRWADADPAVPSAIWTGGQPGAARRPSRPGSEDGPKQGRPSENPSQAGDRLLVLGGSLTGVAALLHVAIIIGGPDWYRFFGAGERMARLAARGSIYPTVITACLAAILAVWALYAFSGAGLIRRLPLLRVALTTIAAVYLARGILGVPVVLFVDDVYTNQLRAKMTFMVVSSAICVGLGLCYAIGAARLWRASSATHG